MAEKKSQKYTGSWLDMKNACPAAVCVDRRFSAARMCAWTALSMYMKSYLEVLFKSIVSLNCLSSIFEARTRDFNPKRKEEKKKTKGDSQIVAVSHDKIRLALGNQVMYQADDCNISRPNNGTRP